MSADLDLWSGLLLLGPFLAAAIISYCIIVGLHPLLIRYTLALPNGRSSHRIPTPQGGGIAVIVSTIIVTEVAFLVIPELAADHFRPMAVFAATIGLAVIGGTDDIRPMEALPRLFFQAIAVLIVVAALPSDLHIISIVPIWLERTLVFLGLLWFVNLVNFMDGADWMVVVEVVPIALALAVFSFSGALPKYAGLTAFSLCGALVGFAPFNRPVARLFLGDVGSLPIGLLLGWLLILLAGGGHLAAALLLPLYYLADATVTLIRRLINGEQVTQAHRSHFYQLALDRGLEPYKVTGLILLVNIALIALAACTLNASLLVQELIFVAGGALVGGLLLNFSRRTKLA